MSCSVLWILLVVLYFCFPPLQNYRIYSIKRPGRLLNFWTLRVGAYSRWALIKFSPFSLSSKFILQQNVKMYQSRILTVH